MTGARPSWSFWFWPMVLAASLSLATLIPPLQSPDENSHLARAYLISKGELTLGKDPRLGSGGKVDFALLSFIDAYAAKVTVARERIDPASQARIDALRWGGEERFAPVAGTGYYLPVIYAPHAVALFAGRALDLSVVHSYLLVRVLCLLSCVGLLAAACRFLRPPPLAIALLLLPMSLFQLLSPTIDGLTTCLAVLVLSFFARAVLQEEDLRPVQSWLLAGGVLLLAGARTQLLPMLALPLFVAWTRRSRKDALLGGATILLSLAWLAYALVDTVDVRIPRSHTTGEMLVRYVTDPAAFLRIVAASLTDSELSAFYARSFIGVLGWLDASLPLASYPLLWTGLGLSAVASILLASRQAWLARALLALIAVASALLVFFALLVTWTPHPATTVGGVQGRYFLLPAITLAYAIGVSVTPRRAAWPTGILIVSMAAVSLYALVATVLARYH